eukprot:1551517-Pyramimonas_sp.AAC.1
MLGDTPVGEELHNGDPWLGLEDRRPVRAQRLRHALMLGDGAVALAIGRPDPLQLERATEGGP